VAGVPFAYFIAEIRSGGWDGGIVGHSRQVVAERKFLLRKKKKGRMKKGKKEKRKNECSATVHPKIKFLGKVRQLPKKQTPPAPHGNGRGSELLEKLILETNPQTSVRVKKIVARRII
jgi:hypothetical protein